MNEITTTLKWEARVRAMRLWKNAAATILTGLIIVTWAVFLNGTRPGLTARKATVVVLLLGIIVGALYAWSIGTESRLVTALSYLALIAAVIGLITGSTVALAVLAAGTIALWLAGTAHTIIYPANPAPAPVRQEPGSHDRWPKAA
jgi:hypothetical protein